MGPGIGQHPDSSVNRLVSALISFVPRTTHGVVVVVIWGPGAATVESVVP